MAYSSVMRYTGLSGVDTTSMVEAMMSVHALKYDTLYQKNASYKYKQEAYQSVGNSLLNTQKNTLDILSPNSLRKTSTFMNTSTKVTDKSGNASSAISVKLGAGVTKFNQSIEVAELAKAEKVTIKGNGANSKMATGGIDMEALTVAEDGSASMNVTLDGVTRSVSLSADQLSQINNASDDQKASVFAKQLNDSLTKSFGSNVAQKAEFKVSDGKIKMEAYTGHTMKLSSADGNVEKALGFNSTGITTAKNASTTLRDMFGDVDFSDFAVNGVKLEGVTSDMTVDSFVKTFNDVAGEEAKISFDSMTGSFTITALKTGLVNKLSFGSEEPTKTASQYFGPFGDVTVEEAQDAKVYIGGSTTATYLENNTLNLPDGTAITFNAKTDGAVDINSSQDTDVTKSAVKAFVDMYNSLLTTIYDQTKTTRPTSTSGALYNPLTEEQEKEMSSTEIENWEAKAKIGLLYKDKDLASLEQNLRSVISKPITLDDGSTFRLSDIGVSLNNDYTKGGLLNFNEEKFDKSLETISIKNITEAFTSQKGYANGINTVLDKTVGKNGTLTAKVGLSSSPLFMTKNVMSERIKQNQYALKDMEAWLAKKETMYYSKFSYMETAISNSNSQLAALGLGQ